MAANGGPPDWVLPLIGAGALIIAGGFGAGVWRLRKKATASKGWPTVEGTIISSEIVTRTEQREASSFSSDSSESSIVIGGSAVRYVYTAAVRYRYAVRGTDYESDHIQWGGQVSTNRQGNAAAVVAAHPVGARVTVHYDPADPKSAVLYPEAKGAIWILVLLAAVFAVVGIGVLVSWTSVK